VIDKSSNAASVHFLLHIVPDLFYSGCSIRAGVEMADRTWAAPRGAPVNAADDCLGVSFGPGGLFIGPIPLLQKVDGRFLVRPMEDLEYATGLAFDESIGIARYQRALEGVVRALNDGDQAQALLRVQLTGLPALPGTDAYERAIEAESLLKASPDDPKHPGYPKGAPDGRGGQFRFKDNADAETTADSAQAASQLHEGQVQLERKVVRRAIRGALARMFKRRAGLLAAEAASNLIPVVGEIDDVIAVGQMLDMVGQSAKVYKEGKSLWTSFVKVRTT
jgi:hypothetical protein